MNLSRRRIIDLKLVCAAGRYREANPAPGTLRRYVSGFSWTLLGTLAAQASAYVSMILMARLLSLDSFGRLGTVQATLTAVFGASTLGIGITSTRYIARYRVTDPARAGRIIGLCSLTSLCSGALSSGALLLFADVISRHVFHATDLTATIRITAPYCVLMTMNAHQIGALLGFEAYGRLMRAQALQGVTTLGLTALLVSSLGFNGAVLSLPLAAAFAWIYMHRELAAECRGRHISPTFRGAWKERVVLMGFALPASLSGLIGSLAIWGAQGMLVRAHGGLKEMGLWTAAFAIRSVVMTAPGVLNRVSSPILSSLHDHETGEKYSRTLWSTATVATVGASAAGLIILLAGPLLLKAFGNSYRRAVPLLPLVIGSAVAEVYASSICQAMIAHARMKYQLVIITAWGTALVLVAFFAIPRYLARGLALGYFVSWIVAAVGYTLIVRKLLALRGRGSLTLPKPVETAESQIA
jgi:O-antigen/teichoic acid export membrane protein